MTKQEILDALELLKELTNHTGKQSIDGIKAGISMNLLDRDEAIVPSEAQSKEDEPTEPEEEAFVSGGRFAEKKAVTRKNVSHGTKKKK